MKVNHIHPAPVEAHRTDHRSCHNRDQMNSPSELSSIWKRTVEGLAVELCIEPIEAHGLLRDSLNEVTIGIAWGWWLP
jgi:hypothetical protein